MMRFYSEELLASHSTPKLVNHIMLAVHDCLFNILTVSSILETIPPSATEDRPCGGERVPVIRHEPKPEHYHKDPTVHSPHYFTMRCEKMRPAIISRS
jgi:hypothetical protein